MRLHDGLCPFYFLTFNTRQRQRILARNEVHDTFVEFCAKAGERDIAVGRYVLMPDHVHLFVMFPREGMLLGDWVKSLRAVVGKCLLKLGHAKPHWQEGFFDHVLRSAESYGQKWEYVRMNPVRAGHYAEPGEWPFQGEITRVAFDENR